MNIIFQNRGFEKNVILSVGIKKMNRKILAFFLAPSPVLAALLILCLYVALSPIQMIDGKVTRVITDHDEILALADLGEQETAAG